MANLPTPALRKKRILRGVCLLLLCPLVLLLTQGFSYFTRSQALWALQKTNLLEGGRAIAWSSPPEDRDTAYAILRRDGWCTVGTLRRVGPFWEPVRFNAVQPDDTLPITLLFEDAGVARSFLCVLSSDPQIVTMELDYVAGFSKTSSSPQQLRTLRQEAVEHCFLFPCGGSTWVPVDDPFQSIRFRGYDTAGNPMYESPMPSLWMNYDFFPMGRGDSMANLRFENFCQKVCQMLRWKAAQGPVSTELTAHLEDHAAALKVRDLSPEEATAQAVTAMGNPYALGHVLD